MTDKRKPSHDLASIRRAAPVMVMTRAALTGAQAMGMGRKDMEAVIGGLTHRNFYKSVTTHADHRVWMDVYHARAGGYDIYIKFVQDMVAEFACTSFKELDP
ncbi:MAG: type II toxin-antitoxin system MqsR family toxin [Rubellimicrobium sp.]|nr:type II toxin-antitoxin system MqsR family toxin [Rubellimicrobium sp.]